MPSYCTYRIKPLSSISFVNKKAIPFNFMIFSDFIFIFSLLSPFCSYLAIFFLQFSFTIPAFPYPSLFCFIFPINVIVIFLVVCSSTSSVLICWLGFHLFHRLSSPAVFPPPAFPRFPRFPVCVSVCEVLSARLEFLCSAGLGAQLSLVRYSVFCQLFFFPISTFPLCCLR